MQKSEDPLSYLHKKQVKLQEPLGICCSTENEDFLVYSKTNMSVHNINGVLLSGLRIKNGQPRISKASIIDNQSKFEDHYIFVGYEDGSANIYICVPKSTTKNTEKTCPLANPGGYAHAKGEGQKNVNYKTGDLHNKYSLERNRFTYFLSSPFSFELIGILEMSMSINSPVVDFCISNDQTA